jgi:hypothetical protein
MRTFAQLLTRRRDTRRRSLRRLRQASLQYDNATRTSAARADRSWERCVFMTVQQAIRPPCRNLTRGESRHPEGA